MKIKVDETTRDKLNNNYGQLLPIMLDLANNTHYNSNVDTRPYHTIYTIEIVSTCLSVITERDVLEQIADCFEIKSPMVMVEPSAAEKYEALVLYVFDETKSIIESKEYEQPMNYFSQKLIDNIIHAIMYVITFPPATTLGEEIVLAEKPSVSLRSICDKYCRQYMEDLVDCYSEYEGKLEVLNKDYCRYVRTLHDIREGVLSELDYKVHRGMLDVAIDISAKQIVYSTKYPNMSWQDLLKKIWGKN